MRNETGGGLCPETRLMELIQTIALNETQGLAELHALLQKYESDARLHFLHGSLLASRSAIADALMAMTRAVEIAPDYAIARFQLGFLHLTSGHPGMAEQVWASLSNLPEGHWLGLFVRGLKHLIRDEFDAAVAALQEGILRNDELPQMNDDMRLIIGKIKQIPPDGHDGSEEVPAKTSAVDMLLRQFGATRH